MDLLIDQHKTPDVTRKLGSVRGERTYLIHVLQSMPKETHI